MNDDVARVEQHPVGLRETFGPHSRDAVRLHDFGKFFRHRRDLTAGSAAGNNHIVGNVRFPGEADDHYVLSLVRFKGFVDPGEQGFRRSAAVRLLVQFAYFPFRARRRERISVADPGCSLVWKNIQAGGFMSAMLQASFRFLLKRKNAFAAFPASAPKE